MKKKQLLIIISVVAAAVLIVVLALIFTGSDDGRLETTDNGNGITDVEQGNAKGSEKDNQQSEQPTVETDMANSEESPDSNEQAASNPPEDNPEVSGDESQAAISIPQPVVQAMLELARQAGDPYDNDFDFLVVEGTDLLVAYLQGDGRPFLTFFTQIPQIWLDEEASCDERVAILENSAPSLSELWVIVFSVPDGVDKWVENLLHAVVMSSVTVLTSCSNDTAEEHNLVRVQQAWLWSATYQWLVEINAISEQ